MNIAECEEKIDVFDDELEEMPVESLIHLLALVNECGGGECSGCDGQRLMLQKLIAEKSGNIDYLFDDDGVADEEE